MTKVLIHGQEYPISAAGDDEYIQRVARYVDEIMTKLGKETSGNSVTGLAILAALNITDELFITRTEKERLVKYYEDKTRLISENLENEMTEE